MKPKIIICTGLPASGKSTFSKEFCQKYPNFIRVNKDDIRAMMASEFSRPREDIVLAMRDEAINAAMNMGFGVIVDDTNFEQKHINRVKELVKDRNIDVEVKFFDVPLSVCIARNSTRANPVPESVIIDMARKYNVGKELVEFPPIQMDKNLPRGIIVDIDGTIAEKGDRSPFDWSRVSEDSPHHDIIHLVELIALGGYEVIFVSGRSEECRRDTEIWLMEYFNIPTNRLLMRKSDDKRKDSYVKYDILQDIVKSYNICYVIDDRDQVVKMWRNSGIRCLQVAEGNF